MASSNSGLKWVLIIGGVFVLIGGCCVAGGLGMALYWRKAQEDFVIASEQALEESLREQEAIAALDQDPLALPAPAPLTLQGGPASDRLPRRIEGTVTTAMGPIGLSAGTACSFDVNVIDSDSQPNGYWCRVQANCGGVPLYGIDRPDGSGNGYFPCDVFPGGVAGEDRGMSAEDTDPFFQIDTRRGRFVVIDDQSTEMASGPYRVEASIHSRM